MILTISFIFLQIDIATVNKEFLLIATRGVCLRLTAMH